jgi:UDP-N-acetylmuramoyl-tripeptide--D-alanyl-D-alanine ligase
MKKIFIILVLGYFRFLARIQLKKNPRAVIIGVTGSAGKTSTRLALVRILRGRGRVKNSVHANSQSGIPLNILGLSPHDYSLFDWLRLILLSPLKLLFNWEHFDYYVVEMGIDSPDFPKNMAYLLSVVHPHLGIVLNASLVHSAAFDHLVPDKDPVRRATKLRLLIAREKMQLAQNIPHSGTAIFNLDQGELLKYQAKIVARQLSFGKSARANLRILSVKTGGTGFHFRFSYQAQNYILSLPDPLPLHYAYTFAAAIAAAASLGITPTQSLASLSLYRSPAGRLRLFSGINNSTIIDSSYNASPDPTRDTLDFFHHVAVRKYKLAVIGDMRELGDSTKLAHKQLADWIIAGVDEVILFGPRTREYTLPVLLSRGFPARHFSSMAELVEYLRLNLRSDSWVLIKGSQNGILLERTVEAILKNPEDTKLLCRRGSYWDKIRSETK